MRYIDDATVSAVVTPVDVFGLTRRYLAQREWSDSATPDAADSPVPVKVGYRDNRPAAWRLRLQDSPARYLTVLREAVPADAEPAAVASTYLTYQRTAALLLLLTWQAARSERLSILVVGAGRLGCATAALAVEIFPRADVQLCVRSRPRHPVDDRVSLVDAGGCAGRYDLVVTATGSRRSLAGELPLHSAHWLAVGGDVRTGAEVAGVPLVARQQFADCPANATSRGLLAAPRALTDLADQAERGMSGEAAVVVVCGGGGIDGFLAAHYLHNH